VISLIILGCGAVLFLVFLASQVWRHSRSSELAQATQLTPVDLDAFENLTDPAEEEYLRSNLTPAEFRSVQRLRIRAAKLYIAAFSQNASILVGIGQSARSHSNPEIAAGGQELFQRALRIKMWCMVSTVRLNGALAFPGLLSPPRAIASRYMAARSMAASIYGKSAA
jgi:hypothetical protein